MNHDLLEVKEEAKRLYGMHRALVPDGTGNRHELIKSHCKNSLDLTRRANPDLKDYWHDLNMEISYLEPTP
ncbi:hypothetical protein E0K83_03860 [Gramella sp. BOM4]|nr:hypothetical protein [Christiangramia bathymodioli]